MKTCPFCRSINVTHKLRCLRCGKQWNPRDFENRGVDEGSTVDFRRTDYTKKGVAS